MSAEDLLLDNEFDDIIIFESPEYDDALVGVSINNQAVYDYDKMIECLMKSENFTEEQAREWIEFNTISSLPPSDNNYPIVMYPLYRNEE